MKLSDLDPRWYSVTGDARHGMTFECPHCLGTGARLAIALHVDGTNFDPDPTSRQQFAADERVWQIVAGTGFDDISLSPSVDASASGHWHGFITGGMAT